MGIQDDIKRLEIRNERLHRLRLLELRQARQGIETPPDVVMEIAETKAELGLSDLLLAEKASGAFAEELGPDGRFLVTTRLLSQLAEQLAEQGSAIQKQIASDRQQLEARIDRQGQSIEERIDRVEEYQAAVNDRQDRERRDGQRRTRLALFVAAIALLTLAGAVVSIAWQLRAL